MIIYAVNHIFDMCFKICDMCSLYLWRHIEIKNRAYRGVWKYPLAVCRLDLQQHDILLHSFDHAHNLHKPRPAHAAQIGIFKNHLPV